MPVRIPICNFDAKTGILCSKCEQKLRSGQITKTDVEVSKVLVEVSEKDQEMNKVALIKAHEVDGNVLLELNQEGLALLRTREEITRKIQEKLGRKLWLTSASSSDRAFLEDLFYPQRILTVNIVWLPDGSKLTKLIVPWRTIKNFQNIEDVKKIAKSVRGIELMVETEREAVQGLRK